MERRAELELNDIENGSMRLRTKPSAQLSYSFVPQAGINAGQRPERLVVFLSGLDSPKTLWQGAFSGLADLAQTKGLHLPPLLAYDRFGIGKSDHDPSDVGKAPEEYHDGMDAVRDLRQLLIQIAEQKLDREESELDKLRLAFCAHSFGVCVARLYAQTFPGSVEALLIMDSALSNKVAEKFLPNPDIPGEWEEGRGWLPPGTTPEMCRDANRKLIRSNISGHAMTTRERIRWTNMPAMLPFSDRPRLRGPEPNLPLVTVMCCDMDVSVRILSKVCPALLRLCRGGSRGH